jgi:cytoskeletal protein CcmA (bactofilin family)
LARTALALFILTAFAVVGWISAVAQTPRSDHEVVLLTGTHSDVQFLAGRSVTIKANVADDVFAAGRDVTFDTATVNNAIVAGYDVEQRGGTTTDFIALASNLRISGAVKDDLVASARSIRFGVEATVGGDSRLAAETIDMEGQINGSMRAAAQRVTVAGKVAGKADLLARRIVIASGAVITGDLIYRGKDKPEIADGATITGQVRQIPIELPDLRTVGWAVLGFGLLLGMAWSLATLLLVVMVHFAFPHFMATSALSVREHPWSNLGRGIAIGLIAPALAGALMASVFAIPLGSALFMSLAIAWLLGLATVAACIGLWIRNWRAKGAAHVPVGSQTWWAVLGAVILALLLIVPILGWLIVGLATAAGLGAATAELWRRMRHA